MPRLVVLSEGYTGRTYELTVEKTTIGRVDDNSFSIPDGSMSSHHCEIHLKGNDVVVKDLNSTNGTFVAGEQVTDTAPLKPGQILRLGSIEIRLEDGATQPPPKAIDRTQVIKQGIKAGDLEKKSTEFKADTSHFKPKSNKVAKVFIVIGVILFLVIVGALIAAFMGGRGK
ncbi:MAG TPA: FHA domain-containing protein [Verrucomicrobiae bacterium]